MKFKILINILLIIFISTCGNVYASDRVKDSLLSLNITSTNNSQKTEIYIELSELYLQNNRDSSLIYAELALRLAEIEGNSYQIAKSNRILAKAYFYLSDYPKSIEYHLVAVDLFEKINDYNNLADEYSELGLIYSNFGNLVKSRYYYQKAVNICKKYNLKLKLAKTYLNYGRTFYAGYDIKKALFYYDQAKNINSVLNDDFLEMKLQSRYGELFIDEGQYDEALEHYLKSNEKAVKINEKTNYAFNNLIIGRIYYLVATDTTKNTKSLKSFILDKKTNLKIAEEYSYKALKIFEEIRDADEISSSYLYLSDIKNAKGEYKEAYEFLFKRMIINDSLFNFNKDKKIAYVESQREIAERDVKLKKNELQIKTKQDLLYITISITIAITFILAAVSLLFFNKRKMAKLLEEQNSVISEVNKSKDKFFSIISHDLRNPIGAIKISADVIDNNFQMFNDEEKHEFFTEIRKSATHIQNLLENLLTWARSQSGKISFNPDSANLNLLISNNISLLQSHALNKKINLIKECPDLVDCKIDLDMINTVIRNLITNAIKFTNFEGTIIIGAKHISINENKYVQVYVKDNGVGMSSDIIAGLFRIDVTITTRGTEKETGTGLGLILCKEFVEKHGGSIWVESEINIGSTFYFTIPV